MSLSRAALFLGVLVPVNLAIVSHMTGLRLRTLLPAVPGPLLSGAAAIAVAYGLRAPRRGRAAAALRAAPSSAAQPRSPPSSSCSRSSATSATRARLRAAPRDDRGTGSGGHRPRSCCRCSTSTRRRSRSGTPSSGRWPRRSRAATARIRRPRRSCRPAFLTRALVRKCLAPSPDANDRSPPPVSSPAAVLDSLAALDPRVIGATGGSGTRVVGRIVRAGGHVHRDEPQRLPGRARSRRLLGPVDQPVRVGRAPRRPDGRTCAPRWSTTSPRPWRRTAATCPRTRPPGAGRSRAASTCCRSSTRSCRSSGSCTGCATGATWRSPRTSSSCASTGRPCSARSGSAG